MFDDYENGCLIYTIEHIENNNEILGKFNVWYFPLFIYSFVWKHALGGNARAFLASGVKSCSRAVQKPLKNENFMYSEVVVRVA